MRIAVASLFVVAVTFAAAPALLAQDADPPETPQAKATRLFSEGVTAEEAQDFEGAIAKYEEAYSAVADPALFVRIGQAYQLLGNEKRDFEAYKKSVEAYNKYLELVPEGNPDLDKVVRERITTLETALADEDARKKKEQEDAKQAKIAEKKAQLDAEALARKEKEALEKMRPAIDALVVAGLDQDISLAARLIAGGLLGWKRFAIEGHLAFEGFFPLQSKVGTAGRSLTVLDLGLRFGNGADNFTGVFVSAGGGFGIFGGKPRERRVKDDMEMCAGFGEPDDPNACKFDIDKNITGRLGLGYGFSTSRKTTVAARLDFTYWLLSIDGTQPAENVPAGLVTKPQQGFSLLVGLEFMRWL